MDMCGLYLIWGLTGETQTRPSNHLQILGGPLDVNVDGGYWVLDIPLLFVASNIPIRWQSLLRSSALSRFGTQWPQFTMDSLSITRIICLYLNLLLASGRRGQRISMATHQRNKCHICLYGPKSCSPSGDGPTARAGSDLYLQSINRLSTFRYYLWNGNLNIMWNFLI